VFYISRSSHPPWLDHNKTIYMENRPTNKEAAELRTSERHLALLLYNRISIFWYLLVKLERGPHQKFRRALYDPQEPAFFPSIFRLQDTLPTYLPIHLSTQLRWRSGKARMVYYRHDDTQLIKIRIQIGWNLSVGRGGQKGRSGWRYTQWGTNGLPRTRLSLYTYHIAVL
jgi:hypothetical protein